MKNKVKKGKKIMAIMLVLLTFLGSLSNVFAASGTGNWKGYQYSTFLKTTDTLQYGITARSLINTGTGENHTVFCSELGVDFDNGVVYNGSYYTPTNEVMKKACKIAYFGWYSKYGDWTVNERIRDNGMEQYRQDYAFTQQYIWEAMGSTATFVDSNVQAQYVNFKNNINNQINVFKQRPSFDSTTIEVEAGETKVLTDTNGVFKNYNSINTTKDGVGFSHNKGENTLTISVPESFQGESVAITDDITRSWNLIKEGTEDHDTSIYFDLNGGGQDQLIALNYNDPTSLAMKVKVNALGNLQLSKLNTKNELVDGAVFSVSGPGYNGDVTVKNGKITLEKIKKGTYTIKEKSAPNGYLIDTETYTAEVKPGQTTTQTIINKEPTGNFELVKKNSTKTANLQGAQYRIWNSEYDKTFTTDVNGKILVTGLKLGKYNYQEVKAPDGYLLDNATYSFELVYKNQTTPVVSVSTEKTNDEPFGEITITKEDKELKNATRVDGTIHHGDVNIAGAEYTLYANEDVFNKSKTTKYFTKDEEIAKFTFNESGVATIKIINTKANLKANGSTLANIPLGNYYAKETKVPTGYLKDTEKHTLTLSYKDSKTKTISVKGNVSNQVQKAKFEIIKVSGKDSNTAKVVEGAEFTAILTKYVKYYGSFDEALKHLDEYSKDEYAVFTTDKTGHGVSNLLAYGEYTVNETIVPSPEMNKVEEFYVTIDKNSDGVIKELVENDTPFESYLKIIKVDQKTGKKITFSNATFKLYKLNRDTNEWEETSCKIGKERTFTWTTDENAVAYTEDKLEAGTYKIDEIKVPTGFVKLEEDCIFDINNQNETLEYDKEFDAYITVTVGNKQPTANITINKTIELVKDADLSIVDVKDLSGIKFKVTAKDTIRDMADGSVIYKKGALVGTYNLNKDGSLIIKNLPLGVYEIQEIETLKGLALDNTKHEIKLTQKDKTTTLYEHTENIVNKTIVVEFSKTDITGDVELEGATLQVVDDKNNVIDEWVSGKKTHKIEGLESGKTYKLIETIAPDGYAKSTEIEFKVDNTNKIQKVTMIDKVVEMSKVDIGGEEIEGATIQVKDEKGNIVDEWTSTKESHKIKNLEEGKKYTLHEEVVADGYVKATDVEFEVSTDKETQHLEMVDKIVDITKTDITNEKEIEGAKLQVVDEDNNIVDEWTSTKEAHKVKGLEEGKKYTLIEITAPYGYEIAESIEFEVSYDKATQHIVMKDKPILKNVKLVKIDEETKEIIKDKFTFGIYEDEECTKLIQKIESNKDDGTITFTELRYGTYFIKELQAPADYEISERVVKVEINDKGVFIDNVETEEKDEAYSFEFTNKKIEVPQTGNIGNKKFILGTLLLALLGLALIVIRVYKDSKKDK
ncbi:MAG: hypothetical protein IKQ33_03990 [Clostridia bacterium]|nr:hypothetical protein [Clostridia bacterium]